MSNETMTDARAAFEAWAQPILGDSPNWRGSGECELAWQSWKQAARLRGEAQAEQRAVYLIRGDFGGWNEQSKGGHDWWEGRANAPERRVLYTRPQAALSSTAAPACNCPQPVAASPKIDPDWNMREILSRAAPAPVAGGAVAKVVADMRERADDMEDCGGCEAAWAHSNRIFADRLESALAQDRASQGGAAGGPEGWRPIETAPSGKLCVVGWLDAHDRETPERHDFDFIEEGRWARHDENVERAKLCAPAGSGIPPREAPYQWFIAIPEMASAPTPAAEREVL